MQSNKRRTAHDRDSLPDARNLVKRVLAGKPVSRPVVGPLAVHYCAEFAEVSVQDYTLNARCLADSVIRYYEQFRPDAVWLSADTWVTAEAMGVQTAFPGPQQPLAGVTKPHIQSLDDIDRLPKPNLAVQGRCSLMVDALRRVKEAIGGEVFIVACFDQYPFSLACALMGIQRAMMLLTEDDHTMIDTLMERCREYTVAYAITLAEAGADMLSGGDSPAGLIGPRMYRDVVLPQEQRVVTELRQRVSQPISLHICGDTTPILAEMARSGADVLELDHRVDIMTACRVIGPKITIWGNLDPVSVLAQGTPNEVFKATTDLLHAIQTCNHMRFVVSSGCTLAPQTPSENLHTLIETVHSYQEEQRGHSTFVV